MLDQNQSAPSKFRPSSERCPLRPISRGLAARLDPFDRAELQHAPVLDDSRAPRVQLEDRRRDGEVNTCDNFADQSPLLALLNAHEIGITLPVEDQLDPEQSTSAIVVHHPQAKYFSV